MSAASASKIITKSEDTSNPDVRNILIVDDTVVGLKSTAMVLQHSGFNTLVAEGGEAAFKILEDRAVSLIVLDYQMPAMDGLEFLRRLRADPRVCEIKVIMLTSASDMTVVSEAMRLGIAGYLLKSKDVSTELLARVRKAFETRTQGGSGETRIKRKPRFTTIIAPIQNKDESSRLAPPESVNLVNLVQREKTIESVLDLTRAKTLPGILKTISELCGTGTTNLAELAAIIGQDPIFSVRVLLLAQSAVKGKAKLCTVHDAIRTVGAESIAKLASSIGVLPSDEAGKDNRVGLLSCWEHTIATATVMSKIVHASDQVGAGVPRLIGLCHNLVELLLRQYFPVEYCTAEQHSLKAGRPTRESMLSVFGISYEELTQCLLESLMLPAELVQPIIEFARKTNAPPEACTHMLSRSLSISISYVHGLMLSASANERLSPVALADCNKLLIQTVALNAAEIRSEAISQVCMLAELTVEQEESLLKPRTKHEVPVWYARHPSFSTMDPLGTALSQLCDVRVNTRLPTARELSGLTGIVIAEPRQDDLLMSEHRRLGSAAENIPVLYLSSAHSSSVKQNRPGFKRLMYPVSIRQLDSFISSLTPRS